MRDKPKRSRNGLRDEQAVERILVQSRHSLDSDNVLDRDIQEVEAASFEWERRFLSREIAIKWR
ncbi:MAG: hypothetical protein KF723_12245 [Rhizobiaceae bacterium]|nr:hypothetical protein [Rhizobiaceae bacterium]